MYEALDLYFNTLGDLDLSLDGDIKDTRDSQADFEAAYATDLGKSVAADSIAHLADRQRMFVTENSIV